MKLLITRRDGFIKAQMHIPPLVQQELVAEKNATSLQAYRCLPESIRKELS